METTPEAIYASEAYLLTVGDVMSAFPHSIGHTQTLDAARKLMRKHDIRHLPVLKDGDLVGIVSQRDLFLVQGLHDVDPTVVGVEEAMSVDVFRVTQEERLSVVVATMADRKLGCAVIMDGREVVGIFTVVDALRVLATSLWSGALRE